MYKDLKSFADFSHDISRKNVRNSNNSEEVISILLSKRTNKEANLRFVISSAIISENVK